MPPIKRSIKLSGHQTSISLEDQFWTILKTMAREKGFSLSELIQGIDNQKGENNLSSALRLAVLSYVLGKSEADNKNN